MTPLAALITGLTTGGLTCFAVQGGLLLGILAKREETQSTGEVSKLERIFLPVSAFLVAKAIAYTIAGFLLGWLGARMALTDTWKMILQSVAAAAMLIAGVRLLWPRFLPWLSFTPPAAVRRFVRRSTKSELVIAPAVLGFLTVLIPCGTTQAMELAAMASSSPLAGASIMLGFTLGTFPLFLIIGILARGSTMAQRRLSYAAALVVIGLGLYSFNGVLLYAGSPYSFQNVIASVDRVLFGSQVPVEADTNPVINVLANSYNPDELTIPSGRDVNLTLTTKGRLGCTSIFRIPELNITKNLNPSDTTTFAINFPNPGRYTFTCGMGMYSGTINAI
ncbi:MAG: sulfite exporter TauE/SafE family protein [Candidatus Kerfeldbacteria bacterium]|nr:sulfite exporter TauE/SafE family protein [Candidatus Kerfeldbacteria bacterium]